MLEFYIRRLPERGRPRHATISHSGAGDLNLDTLIHPRGAHTVAYLR